MAYSLKKILKICTTDKNNMNLTKQPNYNTRNKNNLPLSNKCEYNKSFLIKGISSLARLPPTIREKGFKCFVNRCKHLLLE